MSTIWPLRFCAGADCCYKEKRTTLRVATSRRNSFAIRRKRCSAPQKSVGCPPKGAAPELRRTRRTAFIKPERPAPHHGTAFFVPPLAGKCVGRVVRILSNCATTTCDVFWSRALFSTACAPQAKKYRAEYSARPSQVKKGIVVGGNRKNNASLGSCKRSVG